MFSQKYVGNDKINTVSTETTVFFCLFWLVSARFGFINIKSMKIASQLLEIGSKLGGRNLKMGSLELNRCGVI